MEALKDEDFGVRKEATEALVKIGSNEAVGALMEALKDRSRWVREEAAEALVKIGSDAAVGSLIEALNDENWLVRREAAEALTRIPPERLASGLREALKSQKAWIKETVFLFLAKLLNFKDWIKNRAWVRKKAVSFVGYYFDDEKLLDELHEIAAKDPFSEVRSAALEAYERYHRKLACLGRLQASLHQSPPYHTFQL